MSLHQGRNNNAWWAVQSVLLGLSCGMGYYIAQQGLLKSIHRRCHGTTALLPLKELGQKLLKSPWCLLLGTCPHAWGRLLWYPFLLLYLAQDDDEDSPTNRKEPPHSPSDPPDGIDDTPVRGTNSRRQQKHHNEEDAIRIIEQEEMMMTNIPADKHDGRYLEMLVHNVSHTDLVLSVDAPIMMNKSDDEESSSDEYCLCRPRFSAFDLYSRRILSSLGGEDQENTVISFPRYERSDATPRYSIVTPRPSRQAMLPTGFRLQPQELLKVPCDELTNLRFRGRDAPRIEPYYCGGNHETTTTHQLQFNCVFFPLLATLLPRWHQQIATKYSSSDPSSLKKVLLLVTGVGTPRNWTHSIKGNSTQACAELMERFIRVLYPDVTVVRIHSETNIFRYDENISFAKRELMPCIDAYRDAHARGEAYPDQVDVVPTKEDAIMQRTSEQHAFSTDWKQSFAVTLSFADGSPARTHAIQASLRPYKPTYFHFWQLKTFWHDTKICDDDIEVHSFEDMETVPAIEVNSDASNVDKPVQLVVEEMRRFRKHFLETVMVGRRNDIRQFWLRKTKKPVLAVLLVQAPGKGPVLYRGTNMEVSMPTGSLCAERNVIGTALAADPGLKREDLRMVAVLAVPLPSLEKGSSNNKDAPSKSDGINNKDAPSKSDGMDRSLSLCSFASIVEDDNDKQEEEEDWVMDASSSSMLIEPSKEGVYTVAEGNASNAVNRSPDFSPATGPHVPVFDLGLPPAPLNPPAKSSPPGTPRRRIKLYSSAASDTSNGSTKDSTKPNMGDGIRRQRRTLVVHSARDLNPLKPCGACNEWLKKIAESNPYFKVVTFTDADCNGIYVRPCQE